ncbi:hypothetical protein Pse7367_1673 [Thalassoporum mexicanum PCC 7367]|uniref:DUF3352 domain-containing protein n=1 Tax=Thalassoporum mexicanum TaxID=3457544 RepID=UPI00029FDA82|nr:DUF3352 domain-containing protein [Pseudanabaena sp. PCC 7367]AFY69961.1 hypothetical protein Pse7367_1673 [Pseudanabaena sp. PCC 7367]
MADNSANESPKRSPRPRNPSKRKKSNATLPILAAAGAAVVAIGGAIAYFGFWRKPEPIQGLMAIAKVIPQEAHLLIAFNTESRPWQKLSQFGTPESQKLFSQTMEQSPLHRLLEQSQADFDRDVKPWLGGDIVTALVPDPENPNNPPGTLVVTTVTNHNQAAEFLGQYRSALAAQGANFTTKEYKGAAYFEATTRDPNVFVITASLGKDYVAIANSPDLIERVFDTYAGEQNALAEKPNFRYVDRLEQTETMPESLAKVYLDGSIAVEFLGSQARIDLSEPVLSHSRSQIDAITIAVGLQKEGIRAVMHNHRQNPNSFIDNSGVDNQESVPFTDSLSSETTATATETEAEAESSEPESSSGNEAIANAEVLKLLPQETFFVVNGTNLKQSWQKLVEQSGDNPASSAIIDQLREQAANLSFLDLEEDILAWMDGEFAIAALPITQGALANAGFGLTVLIQTSDPEASDTFLQELNTVAETAAGGLLPQRIELGTETIGDRELTTWQADAAKVATVGYASEDYIFWTTGDLAKQFIPPPTGSLPESSEFKIRTTALPTDNQGYFYLNVSSALVLMDKIFPNEVKSSGGYIQARIVLDAIRGIAVTNTVIDDYTSRFDFLITLKPTPGN